jgi:hypothetical protein
LAADISEYPTAPTQGLVIIDPISGHIINKKEGRDLKSIWGDNHSIFILGNKIEIFDVRSGSIQTISLPDDLSGKRKNWFRLLLD